MTLPSRIRRHATNAPRCESCSDGILLRPQSSHVIAAHNMNAAQIIQV